ncbi:MAG: DUF4242 domain-containing protein [Chloroflexi bacterium]|nr:DUF4242 domain-containing protein [Chloroflexota bacterium]
MSLFMDYHANLKVPKEMLEQVAKDTRARKRDQFGVRQVEYYHNDAGDGYCLLDAPSAEAVRQHHEAMGVACGPVHEVKTLL